MGVVTYDICSPHPSVHVLLFVYVCVALTTDVKQKYEPFMKASINTYINTPNSNIYMVEQKYEPLSIKTRSTSPAASKPRLI